MRFLLILDRVENPASANALLGCRLAAELMTQGHEVHLLELWDGLEPIRLKEYYPEFAPYEGQCRFSPCYHLSEPGCAVLEAARAGEVSQARLERYHLLLKKAQEAWRNRYD